MQQTPQDLSTEAKTNITAAVLLIGNEILSGRTIDSNLSFIAKNLIEHGVSLKEARIVPDHDTAIITAIHELRQKYTYVFTTGGIGATHDDITAETISKAFNQSYTLNQEALSLLEAHYGDRLNENRKRMAYMPQNADLIYNPVSAAPGFYVENVYCMAGMPNVMQAMFKGILPTLKKGAPFFKKSVTCNLLEGDIADRLGSIQLQFPLVDIGSYPYYRLPPDIGVTFVVQGRDEKITIEAFEAILTMIQDFNGLIHQNN